MSDLQLAAPALAAALELIDDVAGQVPASLEVFAAVLAAIEAIEEGDAQ